MVEWVTCTRATPRLERATAKLLDRKS